MTQSTCAGAKQEGEAEAVGGGDSILSDKMRAQQDLRHLRHVLAVR